MGAPATAIAAGADGNLWLTQPTANSIAMFRLTRGDSPSVAQFPIPTQGAGLAGITAHPNGDIWFTEEATDKIGHLPTANPGAIVEISLPSPNSGPRAIAVAFDGAIWFTEFSGNRIGRVTIDTPETITEFTLPDADSRPFDLVPGEDGNIWFTEEGTRRIGRLTANGDLTEFSLPPGVGSPRNIASGTDGNLWFTETATARIGRITLDGEIREFDLTAPTGNSSGIVLGPDGLLWTSYDSGVAVARIRPDGTFSDFPIPADATWNHAALGPDGNIWFCSSSGASILRIGHDTVVKPPRFKRLKIPKGVSQIQSVIKVAVRNGERAHHETGGGHLARLSVSDGDCPPGTVSGVDLDPKTPGFQDTAFLKPGKSRKAKITITLDAARIHSPSTRSYRRCSLSMTAATVGWDGDIDAKNNIAPVSIDVIDRNDAH